MHSIYCIKTKCFEIKATYNNETDLMMVISLNPWRQKRHLRQLRRKIKHSDSTTERILKSLAQSSSKKKITNDLIVILICGSTALVGLGHVFSFLTHTQSVGLLRLEISLLQVRYLHTEQHKHRINAYRLPCREWDSNPRSQCSSGRRRFMT
jgi:hypothetical protein